jgi:signal peptidase I
MPQDEKRKIEQDKPVHHKKDRAGEIANTLEWLITAFILAFVFRAFVMEAFRIPTGSMADTLRGAHFRLCCPQCGYKYEYGFMPGEYGLPDDTIPLGYAPTPVTRCPNCGYYNSKNGSTSMPVANGDRILVLKCIYQFFEPKRWDVVVFKNPTDPSVNYIKRLIGLPGETLQIIDGDIYVNGRICRKPPNVQNELWMPIYNNDFQPIRPDLQDFKDLNYGHSWKQPFDINSYSQWKIDPQKPTQFFLDSAPDAVSNIVYNSSVGNDFKAAYAYDRIDFIPQMPLCSDLMVRFYCISGKTSGRIGVTLGKYRTDYSAWIDFTGQMVITSSSNGTYHELTRKSITPQENGKPVLVKFANVDHQLILEYGDEKLTWDLGTGIHDTGQITDKIEPRVKIFGAGKLELSHVGLFRDIHYTEVSMRDSRATEQKPLTLNKDEFFVLGDNSPNSEDGRLWREQGKANPGLPPYPAGIVPRDYLVGKALFVYWPSGFKPYPKFPFSIVPNIGEVRFIYGGSNKQLISTNSKP